MYGEPGEIFTGKTCTCPTTTFPIQVGRVVFENGAGMVARPPAPDAAAPLGLFSVVQAQTLPAGPALSPPPEVERCRIAYEAVGRVIEDVELCLNYTKLYDLLGGAFDGAPPRIVDLLCQVEEKKAQVVLPPPVIEAVKVLRIALGAGRDLAHIRTVVGFLEAFIPAGARAVPPPQTSVT
jgi:hypothetical protein